MGLIYSRADFVEITRAAFFMQQNESAIPSVLKFGKKCGKNLVVSKKCRTFALSNKNKTLMYSNYQDYLEYQRRYRAAHREKFKEYQERRRARRNDYRIHHTADGKPKPKPTEKSLADHNKRIDNLRRLMGVPRWLPKHLAHEWIAADERNKADKARLDNLYKLRNTANGTEFDKIQSEINSLTIKINNYETKRQNSTYWYQSERNRYTGVY